MTYNRNKRATEKVNKMTMAQRMHAYREDQHGFAEVVQPVDLQPIASATPAI
ncbi:hypothetical protein ACQEXU_15820 [Vibrio sp. TRT 21S02]|uniref:hypothetical protein n=1 Tax=unclassified Vibrio TaxID=2614977 RepID=UPI00349FCC25